MTARKLTASTTKAAVTPTAAMTRPATAGPMIRALLNIAEFRATALPMSSRPTISTANDWRTGMSTALTVPMTSASRIRNGIDAEPRERHDREGDRQAHLDDLGDLQRLALGEVVGQHAGEQSEDQDRQELGGRHHAEPERVVGQLEDEPGLRDLLHPGPDERDRLTAEEQPVVAVAEGAHPAADRGHGSMIPQP